MKSLVFCLVVLFSISLKAQDTFINFHGFNVHKIIPQGIIKEYANEYYFFWGFTTQSGGNQPYKYTIAKYDTEGSFLERKDFGNNLFFPSFFGLEFTSDSTFTSLFSSNEYSILQKNDLNGKLFWSSSSKQFYFDFHYSQNQIYAVGKDTVSPNVERQGIFIISEDSGKVLKKTYMLDYPEFNIVSKESDYKLLEITTIDSSIYIVVNRIQDSAKYIYEFNKDFIYQKHFEIEKDFFKILNNDNKLSISHKRNTSDLYISKGRLVVYKEDGTIEWVFEIEKDNLNFAFYVNYLHQLDNNLLVVTHNYLKNGGAWQEVFKLNNKGKLLKRFRLNPSGFNLTLFNIEIEKNGFLLQGTHSDYESLIIKTDTCFNATSSIAPFSFSFPECGLINSNKEIFQIENEFSIFPNPSNSLFYINNFNQRIKTIQLLDLNGIEIHSFNLSQTINLTNFQQGIYILEIEKQNGEIERHKIIKQ